MGHLNAVRLSKLLQRPADEPELFAHLGEGCEECEAFLAASADPLLDGTTDAALLALAPAAAAANDARAEATFKRIRAPGRDVRWLYAVAAVLLAVVALLLLRPEPDTGLKGGPHVAIELQAVVKQGDQLTRVDKVVPASGVLLLRYHASENATARLSIIRGSAVEALGEVKLESGTHDLTREGAVVGVSLNGERGPMKIRLEVDSAAAEIEVNVVP
jgi:hypothetical protein